MLQLVVILSIVHVLNFRTIIHNIFTSFSISCTTTKLVFVNTLLCQMKYYSNIQILHFFRQKKAIQLLELNLPPIVLYHQNLVDQNRMMYNSKQEERKQGENI